MYNNNLRIRALDELAKEVINPFEPNNPLFKDYISIIDDVFNKGGAPADISYYVLHENNFEESFCNNDLIPIRETKSHKSVLLTGKVGRGKTTFIKYCIKKFIPNTHDNVLVFYIDSESYKEQANYEFEDSLINTMSIEIEKRMYQGNSFLFQQAFVSSIGFNTKDQRSISHIFKDNCNLPKLLKFIDNLEIKTGTKSGGILVVVDNLDENPKTVLLEGDSFVRKIRKIGGDICKNKSLTTLVAVREYNAKYFDTNYYYPVELPRLHTLKIVEAKIHELYTKISKSVNDYAQDIDYYFQDHSKSPQKRRVTLDKPAVINFLKEIVRYLHSSSNNDILDLLNDTSAGNLKIVVANVFNILQSKKLPLTTLFAKHFVPQNAQMSEDIKDPLKFDIILECLLSVHFPYFSHNKSRIMNLFNCRNSSSSDNFHCVLVIPRILYYLDNTNGRTFNEIEDFFNKHKYDKRFVLRAIERCFEYGLFDTAYGTKISHIDKGKTRIKLSVAGKYYLSKLITEVSYLQYVCEDTFVSTDYYVSILKKYGKYEMKGNKVSRLESAHKLILFIKVCEERELEQIRLSNNLSIENYLNQASAIDDSKGKGMKLSEHLLNNTSHKIEYLKKQH